MTATVQRDSEELDHSAYNVAFGPDADGLQVIRGPHALDSSPRDVEGLQLVQGPRTVNIFRGSRGQILEESPVSLIGKKDLNNDGLTDVTAAKLGNSDGHSVLESKPSTAPHRKIWWIISGGIVAIVVVIIAAVLGIAFGIRASHGVVRNASTTGTWHGTGFSNAMLTPRGGKGYLIFQDYTGLLLQAVYSIDNNTHRLTLESPQLTVLPDTAANGTALTTITDMSNSSNHILHMFYINKDGILDEMIQQNSPRGAWSTGTSNLSSHGFTAPYDNRAAMSIISNSINGKNGYGFKVFAGGIDTKLHQYSFDRNSNSWADKSSHDFEGSWAYGGSFPIDSTGYNTTNRTLFTTSPDGLLQAYVQINHQDSMNDWPAGGNWNTPVISQQKMPINSSFAFSLRQTPTSAEKHAGYSYSLVFADANSQLACMNLNFSLFDAVGGRQSGFLGLAADFPTGVSAMPGTYLDWEEPSMDTTLLWYQDNGESLAWMVLNGSLNGIIASGHVVQRDLGWVSVCDGLGCT